MTVGVIRLLLVLMVISLGLWIVFAKLVVPQRPFNLQDWDRVALAALLTVLGFWLVALVISSPALIQRLPAFYRGVAILTLNTLVLLACVEVAATGVLKI